MVSSTPVVDRLHFMRRASCLGLAVLALSCTYYQPVVVSPGGSNTFDRSWNAALAAAADVSVSVYQADRTSGTIRGTKDASDVTMRVFTQADGRVRVELNVKDPPGAKSTLADQLSSAYNRNMGR